MDLASSYASPVNPGNQQTAKRKFFQWAVKWFYANMAEDTREKPDAPALASLLQSIGFQLREFEKIDDNTKTKKSKPNNDTVRVYVECGKSGMRACLELNDVKCQCPNSEDAKDAAFWSISGTGPAVATVLTTLPPGGAPPSPLLAPPGGSESTNRIEESGSNLLPRVSKETTKILHDVTYHLLNIIMDKTPDINQNCKIRSNMNISQIGMTKEAVDDFIDRKTFQNIATNIVRSHTQPEILLSTSIGSDRRYNWSVRPFEKEFSGADHDRNREKLTDAIDLEYERIDNDQPQPSPPKIASSPLFLSQLSSSLSQISLQSEEENVNVTEHLVRARKSLDKAMEILLAKKSPNSRNSSKSEQGTFLKPAAVALNNTTSGGSKRRLSSSSSTNSLRTSPTILTNSRPSSSCSMPGACDISTPRAPKTRLAGPSKSSLSLMTRRSIDLSIATKLSTATLVPANPEATKRNSTVQQANLTISKIPGRRKSFSAPSSQPLKLAAVAAKNSIVANSKINKNSTSPTVQKSQSSINPPAPTGNLKFGYAKKKSSIF